MLTGVGQVAAALRAAGCVFAEEEAALLLSAAPDASALSGLLARRVAGEPLELVVGWAEFAGHRLAVAPGVFLPRARTELLASLAAKTLAGADDPAVAVDLCTGTGAIAVVLATQVPSAVVVAADLDSQAVDCARRNAGGLGVRVFEGDLFQPLPRRLRGSVDVLVANVPYVPSGDVALLPREARDHEPLAALDGGPDGLSLLRRTAVTGVVWLRPGGAVLFEVSRNQASPAMQVLRAAGLDGVRSRTDDDPDRVVVGGNRPQR